jgi:hypothetical protein
LEKIGSVDLGQADQ